MDTPYIEAQDWLNLTFEEKALLFYSFPNSPRDDGFSNWRDWMVSRLDDALNRREIVFVQEWKAGLNV